MPPTHRQQVEAILAGARAEHRMILASVSPALAASLPVDATGITQAIAYLADAIGMPEDIAAEQARGHRANPAVLHGRVYGREPLPADTVLAAFVDGARVRAQLLAALADAAGGAPLTAALALDAEAVDPPADVAGLRAAYAAQEAAAVRLAAWLDGERDLHEGWAGLACIAGAA